MEKSAEPCKSPRHKPEPDQPEYIKAPRRDYTTLSSPQHCISVMDNLKAANLTTLFNLVVTGKQSLNAQNNLLFLEAIWTYSEPVGRFHALFGHPTGLSILQSSLWFDVSPPFLNNAAAKLLQAMKSPSLASTSSGSYLRKIVQAIVDPPIFWDAFVDALRSNQLEPDGQASFAWLLLQLVTLSPEMAKQYAPLANDPAIIDVLYKSSRSDIEDSLKKIGRTVASSCSSSVPGVQDAPGGRHRNDQSLHFARPRMGLT